MGNAAHRRRMNETHNRPTFLVRSTLGFPRGEAAERSEADEGWRQVGSGMQLDEGHMFWFSPFNVKIYNF